MSTDKPIVVCGKLCHWTTARTDSVGFIGKPVALVLWRGPDYAAYITVNNGIGVCSSWNKESGHFFDCPSPEYTVYGTQKEAVAAAITRLTERGFIDPLDYLAWLTP